MNHWLSFVSFLHQIIILIRNGVSTIGCINSIFIPFFCFYIVSLSFCRYIRFSYLNIFLMLVGNILLWGYLNDIFSYLFVNPLIAQKFEYYQGLGMNINGKILRFVEYVLFPFILVYYNRKKLLGKIDKYDPIYMLYFSLLQQWLPILLLRDV